MTPTASSIIQGHCLDVLRGLPSESVQCAVTSPPYWALFDYGIGGLDWEPVTYTPMSGVGEITVPAWHGQLGHEPTAEMYVGHLVAIFRELRRVLKRDGVFWLNLGDAYNNYNGNRGASKSLSASNEAKYLALPPGYGLTDKHLKLKDLLGTPWRVALALQADGWYLRSDVIWSKPHPKPERVKDRPTKAHEYIFQLTKSDRYAFDMEAFVAYDGGRAKRSVWEVKTRAPGFEHYATFPIELVEPCVLASSKPGDIVLDPFSGTATSGQAAQIHGRRFLGIEMKLEYVEMGARRIQAATPLLSDG